MKIDRDMELLQKVLEKYGFTAPLPPEVRKDIYKRKRKILVDILKKYGRYNPFIAGALAVFFFMKAVGFSLTLAQSAGVLILAGAIAAATVTSGVYYTVTRVLNRPMSVELPSPPAGEIKNEQKTSTAAPREAIRLAPPAYYIASPETSELITPIVRDKVKAALFSVITRAKGPGSAGYAPGAPAPLGIALNIEKTGQSFTITARLIDRATSRILHIYTETGPENSLESMSRKIANDILSRE